MDDNVLVVTLQETDSRVHQLEDDIQHLDHQLMDTRRRLKRLRQEWQLRQLRKEP